MEVRQILIQIQLGQDKIRARTRQVGSRYIPNIHLSLLRNVQYI